MKLAQSLRAVNECYACSQLNNNQYRICLIPIVFVWSV